MKINVAYGADEQFTKYVYVSLFSILINMKSEYNLHCYLFTKTPNKYVSLIKRLEYKFQNFELDIVSINETNVDQIQTSELSHLSPATYYRFFVNLIQGIDKIIYLDSDIIVDSDVSELLQENLDKKIVGVCSDLPGIYISPHIDELGLKNKKYFNAGMMVINLNKRKKKQVSEKCIKLLRERVYRFNDQDVLNITLQNDIKWLPGNYNVQMGYLPEIFGEFMYIGFDCNYYENAIENPKIIHYTGAKKPWKLLYTNPFRHVYGKFFRQSMSIGVIESGGFLYDCFVVFVHDIEDCLFSYNTQKKIRECFLNIKSKI